MSAVRSLSAVVSIAAVAAVSFASPVQAAEVRHAWVSSSAASGQLAPPWAPCGIRDPERKLLHLYPNGAGLRCGSKTWGYRHILKEHLDDFKQMAFGTEQSWRDIAHLAIDSALRNPQQTSQSRGKSCVSREIILVNLRTKREVGRRVVRVVTNLLKNNDIITAYPSRSHCGS